jgi:hypothetical protein
VSTELVSAAISTSSRSSRTSGVHEIGADETSATRDQQPRGYNLDGIRRSPRLVSAACPPDWLSESVDTLSPIRYS